VTLALLINEDSIVASWAYQKFDVFPIPVHKAFGVLDTEKHELVGAALFQNYIGTNVDLSYYGPKTITLGIIRNLAKAALDMGISRGTVITSKRNRRFIKGLLKIGFKFEGAMRFFYGHEDNNKNTAVRFVIFRPGLEKLAFTPNQRAADAVRPPAPLPN
jgi:RimJ/RimL family protein N-acetyltransferase